LPKTAVATAIGRSAQRAAASVRPGAVLCVANFPANTGYAWDFIESLYAGLADRLAAQGRKVWVAYPEVREVPRTLAGSAAKPVQLTVRPNRPGSAMATIRFIRDHGIEVLYLADQPAWHPAYALLKIAGIKRIIAHDHTSGTRTVPKGLKRLLKLGVRRTLSFMFADVVIAVSDFVARRKVEVDLVPRARVRRIWNSLLIPEVNSEARRELRDAFGLGADVLVVLCACRAAREKGVEHLIRAFEQISQPAVLVYMGDGPDFVRLERMRLQSSAKGRVIFAGYRPDAKRLMEGADVCVVPSVWEEAFGLAALEPMARGVPVIATSVGGIPEVVIDGETGMLVPPADPGALAHALESMLEDASLRGRMGEEGRARAAQHFSLSGEIEQLTQLIEPCLT